MYYLVFVWLETFLH